MTFFERSGCRFLQRELMSVIRRKSDWLPPIAFFLLVVILFPLTQNPNEARLESMGAGVIWVAFLLATLLALPTLFRADWVDGSLDEWLLSPHPTTWLVVYKVIAQGLVGSVPLILLSPLVAGLFHLPIEKLPYLILSLMLGAPLILLEGALIAALTVGQTTPALFGLLLLPLYIPPLLFAGGALTAATPQEANTSLWFLGSLTLLGISTLPLAITAALKIGVRLQKT